MAENMMLIAEHGDWDYYFDDGSRVLTKKARSMDKRGIELTRWVVCLAKNRATGESTYVLFDDKGEPKNDADSIEGMSIGIDTIKYLKASDNDIIEMAKKRVKIS